MIGLMDERPPYVQFDTRAVEDREASNREGRYIAKNVNYAIITPAGSKDQVERIADEWIPEIIRKARTNPPQYNPKLAENFEKMYEMWKTGNRNFRKTVPRSRDGLLSPRRNKANIISANVPAGRAPAP